MATTMALEPQACARVAHICAGSSMPLPALVDWREIEVVRHEDGHCELVLHGRALECARAAGVGRVLVSSSHDGE